MCAITLIHVLLYASTSESLYPLPAGTTISDTCPLCSYHMIPAWVQRVRRRLAWVKPAANKRRTTPKPTCEAPSRGDAYVVEKMFPIASRSPETLEAMVI